MIDRNTYGVNGSLIALLQVDAPVMQPPKHAAVSSSPNVNPPTKQRASRSQKRAGAETILRTAWIEYPIFPQFCLDDPSAGGGSRQVILPEETAVVRDQ